MKKLIAVCLTLAMVLCLCACDSGPKTPQEVLAASTEKMMEMKSAEFTMDMNLGMEAEGMELPMTLSAQGEMLMEPQTVHMTMTMDMLILQMNMEMYTAVEGENATTYMGADLGQGMEWMQQKMEIPKNPALSTLESLQMITDLRESSENVEGAELIRYDGRITGQDMMKALESMDVTGQMDEAMGEAGELFKNLDPSLGMEVSYYIEKDTLRIREIFIDMTQLMSAMMEIPEMAETGMRFTEMTVSIKYTAFDTVESIVIPEEVRNAPAA